MAIQVIWMKISTDELKSIVGFCQGSPLDIVSAVSLHVQHVKFTISLSFISLLCLTILLNLEEVC